MSGKRTSFCQILHNVKKIHVHFLSILQQMLLLKDLLILQNECLWHAVRREGGMSVYVISAKLSVGSQREGCSRRTSNVLHAFFLDSHELSQSSFNILASLPFQEKTKHFVQTLSHSWDLAHKFLLFVFLFHLCSKTKVKNCWLEFSLNLYHATWRSSRVKRQKRGGN